jgi:hypothetical protein
MALNYFSLLSGEAKPFIGNLNGADFLKIMTAFSTVRYDWDNETFEPREQLIETMYQTSAYMGLPLSLSVYWNLTENQKRYVDSVKGLEELTKRDPLCKNGEGECSTEANRKEMVALIVHRNAANSNSTGDTDTINAVTDSLKDLQNKRGEANNELVKDKKVFDTDKKAYNFRVKKFFNRNLSLVYTNKSGDPEKACDSPADTKKSEYHNIKCGKVSKTWTNDEYKTMLNAAKTRGTNISRELRDIVIDKIKNHHSSLIWTNDYWTTTQGGTGGWTNKKTVTRHCHFIDMSSDQSDVTKSILETKQSYFWSIFDGGGSYSWGAPGYAKRLEKL